MSHRRAAMPGRRLHSGLGPRARRTGATVGRFRGGAGRPVGVVRGGVAATVARPAVRAPASAVGRLLHPVRVAGARSHLGRSAESSRSRSVRCPELPARRAREKQGDRARAQVVGADPLNDGRFSVPGFCRPALSPLPASGASGPPRRCRRNQATQDKNEGETEDLAHPDGSEHALPTLVIEGAVESVEALRAA
jgi:hypothetical protein